MAIEGLFRIVSHASMAGAVTVNNAYHVFTELAPIPSALQVATDFVTVWNLMRAQLGTSILMENISAQRMLPDTADAGSVVVNTTGVFNLGAGTNTLRIFAPCVLAGVITWRTPNPGRSGRGRTYVAGSLATSSDGTRWHAEQLNSFDVIARAIRDRYQLGGNPYALRLCVFSRKAGGRVPPFSAAGIQEVQAYTVQQYYATMGSRRLGHGI